MATKCHKQTGHETVTMSGGEKRTNSSSANYFFICFHFCMLHATRISFSLSVRATKKKVGKAVWANVLLSVVVSMIQSPAPFHWATRVTTKNKSIKFGDSWVSWSVITKQTFETYFVTWATLGDFSIWKLTVFKLLFSKVMSAKDMILTLNIQRPPKKICELHSKHS